MKFTQEIKDAWVAALRSGDYQQGYESLKYVNTDETAKYCCLGVLADVCALWKVLPRNEVLEDNNGDPVLIAMEFQKELWQQNDKRIPFAEIADYIEDYIGVAPEAQP